MEKWFKEGFVREEWICKKRKGASEDKSWVNAQGDEEKIKNIFWDGRVEIIGAMTRHAMIPFDL